MPNAYRAPEVILKVPWGCKVDIWNIAMIVRVYAACIWDEDFCG